MDTANSRSFHLQRTTVSEIVMEWDTPLITWILCVTNQTSFLLRFEIWIAFTRSRNYGSVPLVDNLRVRLTPPTYHRNLGHDRNFPPGCEHRGCLPHKIGTSPDQDHAATEPTYWASVGASPPALTCLTRSWITAPTGTPSPRLETLALVPNI